MNLKQISKLWTQLFCIFTQNCGLQRTGKTNMYYSNARSYMQQFRFEAPFVPCVHRTLLWDDCEPRRLLPMICSVRKQTGGTSTLMWNAADIDALVRADSDFAFYHRYAKRIMRADLARYLILFKYGGAYFDLDIKMHRPITDLYALTEQNGPPDEYCILFEEHRWNSEAEAVDETDEPIRNTLPPKYRTEALTRVANYAILCTPGHPFIAAVLQLCKERASLEVKNDYDVLFTTGPDVVSHVYHTAQPSFLTSHNVILVSREEHNTFITHHHDGNWRTC